ncbi:MAG: NPCBM/NEW2 domain-containing protein [Pirellulaceae bacterium]
MNPIKLAAATACLVLVWLPCPGFAQSQCTITRITGERETASIREIVDGMLQVGNNTIALDELMVIQTDRPVEAGRQPVRVYLSGGGELTADAVTFTGEQFTLATPFGTFDMPPESIRGIVWQTDVDLDRYNRLITHRSVEADKVIANTSQGQGVVDGLIESIDQDRLILNYEGRSRPVSLAKVVGIVTADLKPATPGSPRGMIKLVDGSTMSGRLGNLRDGKLDVYLPGEAAVAIDWNDVSMISLSSDRVQWLSDLVPTDVVQNSLATVEFGWQRDRSVEGNSLRLYWPTQGASVEYAKGIGTHAASRIEFLNEGNYDRFAAIVGIDAETGGKGDCIASIWADGIKLWESEIVAFRDPVEVAVDIAGMKNIVLVVRNGRHLDLGDHVDWVEARLLRTAPRQ